jgi:hypothetical protein
MVLLVGGTAVALAYDRDVIGIASFLLLALMSLAYGAVRVPDKIS